MGEITDKNTRILENSPSYEDASLEGLFAPEEFCNAVNSLIESKGLSAKYINEHVTMSKSRYYEILDYNNTKNPPPRNRIIDLCLGIGATKDELNELLRHAQHKVLDSRGQELDRIVIWGLGQAKTGDEIREVLSEHGYKEFE